MLRLTFNGYENPNLYLLEGRTKSPFHPIERDIIKSGKNYRLRKTERGLLEISQPVGFEDINIKNLTDWLITENWSPLIFGDEPEKKYMAILENGMDDFFKMDKWKEGTLQFIAKETLGQHKQIPVTTQSEMHEVTGQTETPWSIEVTFTESADKFELQTDNGLYLLLNYEFIEGDILTIDYSGRKVFLNGNDLRTAVALASNFEELQPGYVSISASHECTMSYDERYY